MGSRLEKRSDSVRKRIQNHTFDSETGEEYGASAFGGFSDYFRRKKIKLQNLDAETRATSSKPVIFKGIVCHVNGYTQPSLNDLHKMIVEHGGGFLQYLDGKTMCTHIIASNLTPKKKEEFKRYRIVKPAWIVDSVNAGKLLPWDSYRLLDEGAGQAVLGLINGMVTSQVKRSTEGYRNQTETSWYTEQLRSLGAESKRPEQVSKPQLSGEATEEDGYSSLDMTSSLENAIEGNHSDTDRPRDLLEVKTELATPPPSTPLIEEETSQQNDLTLQVGGDGVVKQLEGQPTIPVTERVAATHFGDEKLHAQDDNDLKEDVDENEVVSHAVIRNSEILRAISPSKFASMSAEEHNAILLSDPKIRKSTVVDPNFLQQYYRESRLHHLSTWKADLKSQLQALANAKSSSQKARDMREKIKKLPGQRRYVMHVDFDSFFAAVSLKKHPELKDKPCVVAHGGGSGSEIASCNYPARKFGVSNGMWMQRAQALCPDLNVLPYDFPAYEDASRKFYAAILATDGIVQSVSIDEALVDISTQCIAFGGSDGIKRAEGAVNREQHKADIIAQQVRDEVFAETGCNVSVGIGENILLAKVALRKAKPAGQYQLKSEDVMDVLGVLEVKSLPGVAWSIGGKLEEIGIKLVKDIREATKERLMNALGPKTGEKLWDYSRGIDRTEVGDQVVRKSVSAEVNWGVRFENQQQVDEFMLGLCGELHKRLVKERVKGRQLTMKVMKRAADAPRDPPKHLGHGKCDTFNRSSQLGVATNETDVIAKEAIAMLKSFGISPGELRGIGLQMQKLDQIRAGHDGVAESSQRKLRFDSASILGAFKSVSRNSEDISADQTKDDIAPAENPPIASINQETTSGRLLDTGSHRTNKLNTLGTQFVLPTQVDPTVLAELPQSIRASLQRQNKQLGDVEQLESENEMPNVDSDAKNEAKVDFVNIPTFSQLDQSILDALPPDVRDEVLQYHRSNYKAKGAQAVLPQSPRKNRIIPPSKTLTRRKRGGTRGGGALTSRLKRAAESTTLTQSNFVAPLAHKSSQDSEDVASDTDNEDLDPEVLAALPEDIRAEILHEQRRARLQRTGGIDLAAHLQPRASRALQKHAITEDDAIIADRSFKLQPNPEKPTFTSRRLTELPDLRKAISAWCSEFSDEAPYDEDITALCKYVREVVLDESDMSKATAVVRWVEWVVDEDMTIDDLVRNAWKQAIVRLKAAVQEAVEMRGLGPLDYG